MRTNLKKHGLDIPGTAYFDKALDDLCGFYEAHEKSDYYVLTDETGKVVGGIGFSCFSPIPDCAELQKLYLDDCVKGHGFGYRLIAFIEEKMREYGYKASYLETHHNLSTAIYIYEKVGYQRIPRPKEVAHNTMDHFFYKAF